MTLEIRHRIGLSRRYFHVMNRGAHRAPIYLGAEDRSLFVHLMGKFALKYEVPIVSWALMPNHYHLEPDAEGTALSRMMHDLDSTYAHLYNQRHHSTGCLFQGPFKSTAVIETEGLAHISRYIHRNPLDLNEDPIQYPWSSYRSYLGLAPVPPWLKPDPVLAFVSDKLGMPAPEAYRTYVETAPVRRGKRRIPRGDGEEFVEEYLSYIEDRYADRLSRHLDALRHIPLKLIVAWAAIRTFRIPADQVACYCGFETPAATRQAVTRLQREIDQHPDLAEILHFERTA